MANVTYVRSASRTVAVHTVRRTRLCATSRVVLASTSLDVWHAPPTGPTLKAPPRLILEDLGSSPPPQEPCHVLALVVSFDRWLADARSANAPMCCARLPRRGGIPRRCPDRCAVTSGGSARAGRWCARACILSV